MTEVAAGPAADGTCAGRCFSDGGPLRGCWEGEGRRVEESPSVKNQEYADLACRSLDTAAAYPESRAVGQNFACRTFLRAVDCFRRSTEVP